MEATKTLLIFDEIQACSAALNSLKYFKEKANQYHIVAAGSLLGTLLAQPKSYPVGMVKYKDAAKITRIQRELISIYENDFAKHNGKVNSGRILMVFSTYYEKNIGGMIGVPILYEIQQMKGIGNGR